MGSASLLSPIPLMAKKINYTEGDCFAVPLREGGFARGIVVRMDGKGIVFGYFFGPLIEDLNGIEVDNSLQPGSEVLMGQFGDLGLLNGEWKIVGKILKWSREQWKMPPLVRWEVGDKNAFLSTYDDNSLEMVSEEAVSAADIDLGNYPADRLMGYGSVEIKLTKLLTE